MYPNAASFLVIALILMIAVISTVGFSILWGIFAVTLAVTTVVAVHRSIPRKER